MKAFFTRLASGIVLLAIIILGGILGGWFLFGLVLLISVIGYLEFARVFGIHRNILGISVAQYGEIRSRSPLNLSAVKINLVFADEVWRTMMSVSMLITASASVVSVAPFLS